MQRDLEINYILQELSDSEEFDRLIKTRKNQSKDVMEESSGISQWVRPDKTQKIKNLIIPIKLVVKKHVESKKLLPRLPNTIETRFYIRNRYLNHSVESKPVSLVGIKKKKQKVNRSTHQQKSTVVLHDESKKTLFDISKITQSVMKQRKLHPTVVKFPQNYESSTSRKQLDLQSINTAEMAKQSDILRRMESKMRNASKIRRLQDQFNDEKIVSERRSDRKSQMTSERAAESPERKKQFIHQLFRTKRAREDIPADLANSTINFQGRTAFQHFMFCNMSAQLDP